MSKRLVTIDTIERLSKLEKYDWLRERGWHITKRGKTPSWAKARSSPLPPRWPCGCS